MNYLSNDLTMTSLEVVDLVNKLRLEEGNDKVKRHADFMESIRKEVKSLENINIDTREYFFSTSYIDKGNQERPCYRLTIKGLEHLKDNSIHDVKAYIEAIKRLDPTYQQNYVTLSPTYIRKELLLNQILLAWFEVDQIKAQYPVLGYRIDYFIPDCNLIIEYDENSGHKNLKADKKRMNEIIDCLVKKWINFELPSSDTHDIEDYLEGKYDNPFTTIRIKEGRENEGLNELFEFLTDDNRVWTKLKALNR